MRAPNLGELLVGDALWRLGYRDVEREFRVGNYRVDFALPLKRVAVEADGWVHTTERNRIKDKARDAQLKKWGWIVVRVNVEEPEKFDIAWLKAEIVKAENKAWFLFTGALGVESANERHDRPPRPDEMHPLEFEWLEPEDGPLNRALERHRQREAEAALTAHEKASPMERLKR